MASNNDMTALLEEYLEDAAGHLEAAEASLLELEKRSSNGIDHGIVTLLLGNLHTLKGNSGMMGFSTLQQFVHKLESAVKKLDGGDAQFIQKSFEVLYASINSIREALRQLAENPKTVPDLGDASMLLDYMINEKESQDPAGKAAPLPQNKDEYSYVTQKSTSLKVNFSRLDELLNLVGELVIHRTTLTALEARIKDAVSDRELIEDFNESSQMINKTASELREAIMKVRMLPVKMVFQRFTRLVRDLSRSHKKEINLTLSGEDTELDKTVIDEIGEPLLHLIRNAIDHGIESPAERRKAGKPAAGSIRLSACHESNHIVISVEDDGKGISVEKVRASAIAKGLLDPATAQNMGEQDILQLVFLPGFSTSAEVTEISGRGIGLDVVKNTVTSFNGLIEIKSEAGIGSRFTIKLPLTLAIISALMVEIAGQTYAIPLSGVLESIKISNDEIHQVADGEIIRLRERLLSIIRLDSLFGVSCSEARKEEYVVVVGSGEKRGGLVVDRLIGQQEVVIKGMDDYLGELPWFAGGTVLGDGRVALILDIASLIAKTRRGGAYAGE